MACVLGLSGNNPAYLKREAGFSFPLFWRLIFLSINFFPAGALFRRGKSATIGEAVFFSHIVSFEVFYVHLFTDD